MFQLKILLCCALIITINCQKRGRLVKIAQGILEGTKHSTTYNNTPYYSFKGIPYAEPCIGVRKFDIARPPQPWDGIYPAMTYRPPCPQVYLKTMQQMGNEDCLYLNVFTPRTSANESLPVMVYLFAGLFQMGYADDDYYDPEFLVEKDVIVVTLNYRLGALGFLSTADGHAPGNVGMKDQVRALRWIKDNIIHFGGDPQKVTLFGQSSGATAVHLHMMSPMSQGLFRACIIQSGSGVSWWAISRDPRPDAFALGKILGLKTNDTKELMDHLKKTSTEKIVDATTELYAQSVDGKLKRDDIFPFAPSVEKSSGQEVFLPDEPWSIMRMGRIAEVPLIIGITANESMVLSEEFFTKDIVGFVLYYMCHVLKIREDAKIYEVAKYLQDFYLGGKSISDIDDDDLPVVLQWVSDMAINVETLMTAKMMTYRSAKNVYLYKFSYVSSFGMFKTVFDVTKPCAAHGDDLTYLFHTHLYEDKQLINPDNQKMIDIMTKMWTNFARDLNPTSVQDDDINFTWEPLNGYNRYLNINEQPKVEKNLLTDNLRVWATIMKDDLKEYAEIFN